MRMRAYLPLTAVLIILAVAGSAREPESLAAAGAIAPQGLNWDFPMGSPYGSPATYAQNWTGYGYPGFGANAYSPYYSTAHFPYLYFYEQYAREAEESRRAADEYEASLAREGKLTGPLEVGAFKTDFLPRSPLKNQLTLDGQAVTPSPSGAPLVIESGEHTLRVGAPNLSSAN